jgi:hypothetical protein
MEQKLRLVQGVNGRVEKRSSERRRLQVPGQIVWKDGRGQTRITAVNTRDVSDIGAAIECRGELNLPMYRLVYFQVERYMRNRADLPDALRKQSVLAVVFRIGPCNEATGSPTEYGIRLMVEPKRAAAAPRRVVVTRTA